MDTLVREMFVGPGEQVHTLVHTQFGNVAGYEDVIASAQPNSRHRQSVDRHLP